MNATNRGCNQKCPTGIFDCHCPTCECKVCDPDEKEKRKKKPEETQVEEKAEEKKDDEKKLCGCGESTRFHCKCIKCGCFVCDDSKFQKKMEQLQPCAPPEWLHFDKRVVLDSVFECRCDDCICLACDDPYKPGIDMSFVTVISSKIVFFADRPEQDCAPDPDPGMYFLKRPYEKCGGVCSKMKDGPPATSCEVKNVCKLLASRSCK